MYLVAYGEVAEAPKKLNSVGGGVVAAGAAVVVGAASLVTLFVQSQHAHSEELTIEQRCLCTFLVEKGWKTRIEWKTAVCAPPPHSWQLAAPCRQLCVGLWPSWQRGPLSQNGRPPLS